MSRVVAHVGTVLLCSMIATSLSCGRGSAALKGQSNATFTFFGLTVDQEGKPLANVRVEYECEAFPAGWMFEKRGEPLVKSVVSATSDERGRFSFTVDAHTLRKLRVEGPSGYRELYERHIGGEGTGRVPSTYGYLVKSWGDFCYKSDFDHPAIFVFVKDGVTEISALPCRGGYDSGNGTHWVENAPAWPMEPSLPDVTRKELRS